MAGSLRLFVSIPATARHFGINGKKLKNKIKSVQQLTMDCYELPYMFPCDLTCLQILLHESVDLIKQQATLSLGRELGHDLENF